jgi:hypothetical protein
LAGDYNVMPTELDVYAPERWVDDALFRPEVRDAYRRLVEQGWTSVSKLASAASVSVSAIDDFELERRQPDAITTDAIQRAFEDVGLVFLPEDDVQLRGDASAVR